MEQLILETIFRHMKEKIIIRTSVRGFAKGKCLTNLINFNDKMTGLVDEGRTADIICLDYINISVMISVAKSSWR